MGDGQGNRGRLVPVAALPGTNKSKMSAMVKMMGSLALVTVPEDHRVFTQLWSVTGSISILLVDGGDCVVGRRGSGRRRNPDIDP